jgi:hypothetical protein
MNMLELQVLILTSGVPEPTVGPGLFEASELDANLQPSLSEDPSTPERTTSS